MQSFEQSFRPAPWLRPALVQTVLASQKFRKSGTHAMDEVAKETIIDCGPHNGEENVRLMGQLSTPAAPKGLMILLHGWEGSQDSTYVISTARYFFDSGMAIFRLNYRDHGPTHHLNEGMFNATLFTEVFTAIKAITTRINLPTYIIGFSLGGNFGLRIARAMKDEPLDNIHHIFAISPVIDPCPGVAVIDNNALIRRYFVKKWHKSLIAKQQAFPEIYNFKTPLGFTSVDQLSTHFIEEYSAFASAEAFYNGYKIAADDLADCATPMTIIMAKDDPVVTASDVAKLNLAPATRLHFHEYGGHNGFFQSLTGPTWYDDYISRTIG